MKQSTLKMLLFLSFIRDLDITRYKWSGESWIDVWTLGGATKQEISMRNHFKTPGGHTLWKTDVRFKAGILLNLQKKTNKTSGFRGLKVSVYNGIIAWTHFWQKM